MKRRNFIRQSSFAILGGMALSDSLAAQAAKPPKWPAAGVQLYTITSRLDEDLDGSLKRVADIGYKNLESAGSRKGGYYGLKPKEFAAKVKELGMSWRAHHVGGAPRPVNPNPPLGADGKPRVFPPSKNLKEHAQEIMDEAAEGGVEFVVCASIPVKTMDEVKAAIDILGKAGEISKKAGITVVFHNHTAEFEKVEGQLPYELFLQQLSGDVVKMELDLAWATKAGMNPVDMFRKNPGRYPLWHVKDLSQDKQEPVEVGAGYIDFKPIFEAADISGLKYFFVEQDRAPDPLNNIATSFANLKKITG